MICNLFPAPTYFFFSANLPELLYYSHIPATAVALLVGLFVFLNGRQFLLNRLLFIISVCFSLWTLSNLILWTNIHSDFLLLIWTFYVVLFSFISILRLLRLCIPREERYLTLTQECTSSAPSSNYYLCADLLKSEWIQYCQL